MQVETVAGQPTQLLVMWQPPVTSNGVITYYTIFCFESNKDPMQDGFSDEGSGTEADMTFGSQFQNSTNNVTVLGSEMSAVVGGLDPYSGYDCVVLASTSIGEGPPSSYVFGLTDQSSKVI